MENDLKPSLLGMFKNPREQFDRMRAKPTMWIPLLIVTILFVVGVFLKTLSIDASYPAFEGIGKEDIGGLLLFTKVSLIISSVFSPAAKALVSSVIYLIVAKIARSEANFNQLFSMSVHIQVIAAAGLIFNMLLLLPIGGNPDIMITSLASLVNGDHLGLLGYFELFHIWQVILVAIGLHRVAGLSKGWAWGVSIGFYLFGLVLVYISSLLVGL